MAVRNVLAGPLGLLVDQEYGVIAFAPALAMAISAIVQMIGRSNSLRQGYGGPPKLGAKAERTGPADAAGSTRRSALEIALVFITLLATVGAFDLWWGGTAPPGRPLVSALPLLGLPMAWLYERSAARPVQRAAYQLLLLAGIAISLGMMLAQDGLLITQDRDGSSRLLEWLAPLWPVWGMMPSFAAAGLRDALALSALWVGAAISLGWLFRRSRVNGPGAAALTATTGLIFAVVGVSVVAPAIVRGQPWTQFDPRSRSRVALLDEFDGVARPIAIIYDPFTIAEASSVPPLISLNAVPGSRTDPQPLSVLLNARFGLPAGDYEVEIGGASEDANGIVGLQVGRTGPPVREWQAVLKPSEHWQAAFPLPLDAEFVGFRSSPSLQSARSLLLRPIRIVDVTRRLPPLPVLSGARFGSTSLFFHDDQTYPESTGFWMNGRATTLITIAPDRPVEQVTLRLNSGPRPNSVRLETATWTDRIDLEANTQQDAVVPVGGRFRPLRLRLITTDGFIPADVLPDSSDRRLLGCWVEVVG